MQTLEINVTSKRYVCKLILKQKITIIIGESGKGKSSLTAAIESRSGAYQISVSNTAYRCMVLRYDGWEDILKATRQEQRKVIYFVDDDDFIFQPDFQRYVNEDTSAMFVFINRSRPAKSYDGYSISVHEIYRFMANGKRHWCEPVYKLETRKETAIDACIVEDSGSGLTFFKKLFPAAESTGGKGNVVRYLFKFKDTLRNKKIFFAVDWCAFGSWFEEFLNVVRVWNIIPIMHQQYASLEYMLLRSNMFRYDFANVMLKELLQYSSFEQYCTALLIEITNGKPYVYSKDIFGVKERVFRTCYLNDCCGLTQHKPDASVVCDRGLSGDKIESLLLGTEFENLLEIFQYEKNKNF